MTKINVVYDGTENEELETSEDEIPAVDIAPAKINYLTDEVRERASRGRHCRGIFNKYLKSLLKPHVTKTSKKFVSAREILEKGTRLKNVCIFENRKRVGTKLKEVTLLPSDRIKLMQKLESGHGTIGRPKLRNGDLRQEFLDMLPDFVETQSYTRKQLLAVGVPEKDLDDAGIM